MVEVGLQMFEHRRSRQHHGVLFDASLDHSGWTPRALSRLLNLAARLLFEEAAEVAKSFGLMVSRAELERLYAQYARTAEAHGDAELLALHDQPLEDVRHQPGRVMVVQTDGVFVQGRAEDDSGGRAGPIGAVLPKTRAAASRSRPRWSIHKQRRGSGSGWRR